MESTSVKCFTGQSLPLTHRRVSTSAPQAPQGGVGISSQITQVLAQLRALGGQAGEHALQRLQPLRALLLQPGYLDALPLHGLLRQRLAPQQRAPLQPHPAAQLIDLRLCGRTSNVLPGKIHYA